MDFHKLVPLPDRTSINSGLTSANQSTMRSLFGLPGYLTEDCSAITNPTLRAQIVTHKFNNFSVEGWKPAVDRLILVMQDIYQFRPDLHAVLGTAGMLCCRAVRGSRTNYSNHAWGTAIDITIGGRLDPLGATVCQSGVLLAYPFFHKHGFFWAAGYMNRKDPMHFELAEQTIRSLK